MTTSRIDRAFARINRGAGLFGRGFGDFEVHRRIGVAASDVDIVDTLHVRLDSEWIVRGGMRLVGGRFRSPLADVLPDKTRMARFWWLRPPTGDHEPVWVQLAGTNESGPRRRLFIARPLAKRGVSSLILENPFYGVRAPAGQVGNDLGTVSDLLVMGRAAVREARALLGWLGDRGHNQRGVSGYSMGGHMAALCAATYPEPIACAALATGLSAVPIFCADAMSNAIRWDVLGAEHPNPRALMAELVALSDLDRFGPPARPQTAVIVGARHDGYVRPEQVRRLHAHWPQSQLRWCNGGHVAAYVRRRALVDAMADAMAQSPVSSGAVGADGGQLS